MKGTRGWISGLLIRSIVPVVSKSDLGEEGKGKGMNSARNVLTICWEWQDLINILNDLVEYLFNAFSYESFEVKDLYLDSQLLCTTCFESREHYLGFDIASFQVLSASPSWGIVSNRSINHSLFEVVVLLVACHCRVMPRHASEHCETIFGPAANWPDWYRKQHGKQLWPPHTRFWQFLQAESTQCHMSPTENQM